MHRVISFVIANVAVKATPLLQSVVIIFLVGPTYYARIAPYFVIAAFASTLFTTGIVPGYTRSIGEKTAGVLPENSATPSDYVGFVICAVPVSVVLIFGFSYMGAFGDFKPSVAALFSVSTGLVAILVPILLVMRRLLPTLIAVYAFFIASIAAAVTTKWLPVESYQYVFVLASLLLALVLAHLFATQKLEGDTRTIGPLRIKRLALVMRDIAPVFFPNVFWMAMLFWFANRVSQSQSDPEIFSWYVTGLQIFGVLSFIPNSLAPLILLRLTSNTAQAGYTQAMKTSFAILAAALCVFAAILGVIYLLPSDMITEVQRQVWLPMIAAGCFASTFAPLNAYLVKQRRATLIFPGAIVWAIIAHGWMFFDPSGFPHGFLAAYCFAWCALLICVWLAKREPLRTRMLV